MKTIAKTELQKIAGGQSPRIYIDIHEFDLDGDGTIDVKIETAGAVPLIPGVMPGPDFAVLGACSCFDPIHLL